VDDLRSHRLKLAISQSRLARLSGVSRFKICTYELGDGSLRLEEQSRIREALHAEAERLRAIPADIASVVFQSPEPITSEEQP
jgi:predicted transcriptional regulator